MITTKGRVLLKSHKTKSRNISQLVFLVTLVTFNCLTFTTLSLVIWPGAYLLGAPGGCSFEV